MPLVPVPPSRRTFTSKGMIIDRQTGRETWIECPDPNTFMNHIIQTIGWIMVWSMDHLWQKSILIPHGRRRHMGMDLRDLLIEFDLRDKYCLMRDYYRILDQFAHWSAILRGDTDYNYYEGLTAKPTYYAQRWINHGKKVVKSLTKLTALRHVFEVPESRWKREMRQISMNMKGKHLRTVLDMLKYGIEVGQENLTIDFMNKHLPSLLEETDIEKARKEEVN